MEDPRIEISAEDRIARRRALDQLAPMAAAATQGARTVTELRTTLGGALEGWKRPGGAKPPEAVQRVAEDLLKRVDATCKLFANPAQCGDRPTTALGAAGPQLVATDPPLPQRVLQLLGSIEGYTAAPTATQLDQLKALQPKLNEAGAAARRLIQEDLPALNKMMNEAGVPHLTLPVGSRQQPAG
jgi:hypothetical protein